MSTVTLIKQFSYVLPAKISMLNDRAYLRKT